MSAKNDDRSRSKKEASPNDADRTFPYRHHAYFIKGLTTKTTTTKVEATSNNNHTRENDIYRDDKDNDNNYIKFLIQYFLFFVPILVFKLAFLLRS